jgi:hypothetical protein
LNGGRALQTAGAREQTAEMVRRRGKGVECTLLGRIAPNVLCFLGRYRFTIDQTIQKGLVDGISELDDNVIH